MSKSKCIKCKFKNEFESSYGKLYSFDVEFEDGTKGLYNSKDKDNPKFKEGEEAEYETEEKSGVKNGKEWSFTKIKPAQKGFGGGGYKETPEDRKKKAKRTAVGASVDFIVLSGIEVSAEKVQPLHNFFYTWLIKDIDDSDKSKDRATALMSVVRLVGKENSPYDTSSTKTLIEAAEKLLTLL